MSSFSHGPISRRFLQERSGATIEGHEIGETTIAESEWSIVIGLFCLFGTFILSRWIEHAGITHLPEAGIAILFGGAASAIAFGLHGGLILHDMRFDFEFFMIWLLPPIIFEAGYNMNRRAFFENLVPTALFAFGGTVFSTAVVGSVTYAAGQAGLCHPLGGLAALYFGSLISATDPVTVLAVFQKLGVKCDLFAMVFGESVLNDAVAIVLSRTLLSFKTQPVSWSSAGVALCTFAEIFVGSLLIGCGYGIASALTYKHLRMREHDDTLYLEAAMIVTFAWGANYTAEALDLSGIVAILFCGIVMAKYTRDNLSEGAVVLTARLFKVVALLAETFVFVYLGMAAFALPIFRKTTWALVAVAIPACLLGRTHIYVLSAAVNCWRRPRAAREAAAAAMRIPPDGPPPRRTHRRGVSRAQQTRPGAEGGDSNEQQQQPHHHAHHLKSLPPISLTYQHVLVLSGLRGGVAFAIASVGYSHDDFHSHDDSLAIMQTTLMVALFTIFVLGGFIGDIARATGVLSDTRHEHAARARHEHARSTRLHAIDRKHIRPFLTHHPPPRRAEGEAGSLVELQQLPLAATAGGGGAGRGAVGDDAGGAPAAALLPMGPSSSELDVSLERSSSEDDEEESAVRAPALDVHYHAREAHGAGHSSGGHASGDHDTRAQLTAQRDSESLHDAVETLPPP